MTRVLLFLIIGLAAIVVGMRFMPGGGEHKTPPPVAKVDPLAPAVQPSMDVASTDAGSIAPAAEPATEPATEHAAAPATAPVAGPAIPAAFRGEWNGARALCGSGRGETRLVVGSDWLQFHESSGDVSAVRRQNDRIVTLAAAFTGEGQTYGRTIRMELSPSGKELTIERLVRHRCPEDPANPVGQP